MILSRSLGGPGDIYKLSSRSLQTIGYKEKNNLASYQCQPQCQLQLEYLRVFVYEYIN